MMKNTVSRLGIILSLLLSFSVMSYAGEGLTRPSDEVGVEKLTEQQRNQRKHKFQQERLNFIVKLADLNEDEKEWLDLELKKYDNERAEIWIEMRQIREAVHEGGDQITDEQYTDYLNTLVVLHEKIGDTHKNFAEALQKQFSPKKAYIIFDSIRNYNSKMARRNAR